MKPKIDEELKSLIPPLKHDERSQLEENIKTHGCRDALVVWDGTLLDGHNRLEICDRLGLPYRVEEISLPDREAAMDWMDANQLGRRNLTPDQFRLLLGRRYNRTKKAQGGDHGNQYVAKDQNDTLPTADTLSAQHGVSPATVKRAGSFAAATEKLGIQKEVASGEVKATQSAIVHAAKSLPESPTVEQVEEARKHVHVSKNSGENEWYTPAKFIAAARSAMGGIDVDPASSAIANKTVGAKTYYTKDDNGLEQKWDGRVWLNPPYAQPLISQFAEAVAAKYESGEISDACVLVNNATETGWFQRMLACASSVCFVKSRVKFIDPEGNPGAPLQGQAILYFGKNGASFLVAFKEFGKILHA